MNAPAPKKSNFGCLGCFSIICLTFVLLAELAVVWWLNPRWFDRMAFWRGPVYEPHLQLVNDPGALARLEAETAGAQQTQEPREPARPTPFIFGRVRASYDPAKGVELPFSDRASLKIPSGAIGEATEVSVTPMATIPQEMLAATVGPVVDIRVGDREHYSFRRPVELTLPYEVFAEDDQPVIAGWRNGRWEPLPSRVDRSRRTVTADLEHASSWTVYNPAIPTPLWVGAIGGAILTASTSTGRAQFRTLGWLGYPEYETPQGNFKIHYMISGPDAVPTDRDFIGAKIPFIGEKTPAGHPLYVRYLGSLLEQCLSGFNTWGLRLPRAELIRYDVFVLYLDGSFGESGPGGPVLLYHDLLAAAHKDDLNADDLIRYTVAHELAHVVQDEYFNLLTARYSKWFLELMAAYVGTSFWEEHGSPVPSIVNDDLLKGRGKMLLQSMDKTATFNEAGGTMMYRYFIFPRWLDRHHGKGQGLRFLRAAADSWVGHFVELDDFDQVTREMYRGQTLPDLFTEFAQDFYHDDLWKLKEFPEAHPPGSTFSQAAAQSRSKAEFRRVASPLPPSGSTAQSTAWAVHEFGTEAKGGLRYLPHLSAEATYMDVGAFPKSQKAKLVVRFEPYGEVSPDLRMFYAEDKCKQVIPCQSRLSKFEEVKLSFGKPVTKIVDLYGQKGHPDRVTVLAVNRSLESSVSGSNVQRWLLVPPANVQFERAKPLPSRRWKVKWDRVGLKDHAPVWGQYEVLRRRVGQPDSEFVPLNRTEDEFYGGDVPTDDDYVFTVKVIDAYGNKSHAAPVPDRDPFVGDWFGVIREKHGLYLTESMVQIRSVYDDKVGQAWAKIRRMPENTEYERQHKREEIENQKFVEELGDTAMEIAGELAPELGAVIRTAGFPATFSIRRRDGNYFLTVKSVFGFALNEEEFGNLPLEPAGHRALRLTQKDVPLLSKMVFHSSREDFIHARDGVVVTHKSVDTQIDYEFNFSWWFYRSGMP